MARDRRFGEILFGFLFIIVGIGSLFDGIPFGLVLLLLGAILVARNRGGMARGALVDQMDSWLTDVIQGTAKVVNDAVSRRQSQSAPRLTTQEWRQQSPQAVRDGRDNRAFKHAIEALRASGHDPNRIGFLPVDIGLMAFSADQTPELYRTRAIPDDVDYIQPFIVLNLPTGAVGRVRFELIDADGQTVFIHEDMHDLEAGRTLISPAARLPVHDERSLNGPWTLRVFTDNLLLATHHFTWDVQEAPDLRRHLRDDGELSPEIRIMLAESRLQRMSLDELLAPQSQEDEPGRSRRSS